MAIETPTAAFVVVGAMAAALNSNAAMIDIVRVILSLLHTLDGWRSALFGGCAYPVPALDLAPATPCRSLLIASNSHSKLCRADNHATRMGC